MLATCSWFGVFILSTLSLVYLTAILFPNKIIFIPFNVCLLAKKEEYLYFIKIGAKYSCKIAIYYGNPVIIKWLVHVICDIVILCIIFNLVFNNFISWYFLKLIAKGDTFYGAFHLLSIGWRNIVFFPQGL